MYLFYDFIIIKTEIFHFLSQHFKIEFKLLKFLHIPKLPFFEFFGFLIQMNRNLPQGEARAFILIKPYGFQQPAVSKSNKKAESWLLKAHR